jgi:predicted Zn finger-like uncharacterized protein
MDVICERCSTEYEFDETLLSGRGTSVKCTNCGHVFKVYPKAALDADRTTSSWRLKTAGGLIDTIDSLRELQRRISSGELTPDDEIARGDEDWKTLGSIPELETFFQAAGVHIESARIPSPLPPVMPAPAARESSLPPGKRPRQPTLLGVSPVQRPPGPLPAEPEAASETETETETETAPASRFELGPEIENEIGTGSAIDNEIGTGIESEPETELGPEIEPEPETSLGPAEPAAPGSWHSPYARDSFADTAQAPEVEDAVFEEKPNASVRTSTPPPAYYDDDDIPELPARAASPLRWLLIIVAVGGLALVASQWDRVSRLLGIGSDPALIAAGVAEGDAAVAQGHPASYASAVDAYGRAVEAGGSDDPELMAKLSNAYALAAQAQLDSGASTASVEQLVAGAMSTAEGATQRDSRALEPKLATVDALRLSDENADAREKLEEARAMSFSRTAEFYRIDARLSAAEAGGRLENGLRSARQAAELDPAGIRYQLLLARAEQAAGHEEEAREALEKILVDQPEHPVATELLAEVAAAAEPEEEPAAEAEPAAEPAPAPEPVSAPAPAKAPAAPAESAKPTPKSETKAPSPAPKPKRPKPVKKKPAFDEYDRLAEAAGSDAFVDGRPPVLDYESNMTKGREELRAGNYARARAYFDSALEVHPGSADAMDGLGDVATAVKDYTSALRYYRVAAQRGHPDGYFNLGKTYERLGRNEEAVSAYYTYVKRRPSGAHAEAARTAIRTLEPRAKLPPDPEPRPDAPVEPEASPEPPQESEPSSP